MMPVGGNFTSCNCGPEVAACESPTQPVATVGLCLADGTPIAVTVIRDCAGAVTSEGWINLTTGAWTAGQPPAGTVACGDSRSITTTGTFCDVGEDGTVLGLVLVEYQYAADGSIASVRLVDAVTGETYTPAGEVTTCPAGVEAPERDLLHLCDVTNDESGGSTSTPFVRDYQRNETGQITGHADYTLDGQPYTPTGTVGVCGPEPVEPCASTVTVLRLCDLNPEVEPDDQGRRCATPFLRHLTYDCTGALIETRDTEADGVTPYTPVQVVDCGGGGGVPAMVEVPWEVVSIEPDPASPVGRGLVFTLSPIDDPDTVGTVTVTTSSSYGTASCPAEPPAYAYRNPTTYTFTPDQALRDAATYVRCDLIDFDTFEPVTGLTPPPDRLGGTAYWDGTTVRPTESNGTGELYYDGPPETWTYRVGNTGGGNSCSMLSFAAVSLRAEGCCAGCGGTGGGGDEGGRTVQEVCVIANTAPDEVMRWTRVIEGGGATIYYLDQNGDRYDNTLPAGHQIVACPAEEPEPCRTTTSLLLCDLATALEPGDTSVEDHAQELVSWPGWVRLPGGGGSLWSGGTVAFPAESSGSAGNGFEVHRWIAARITSPAPACDTGTGTARVTVRFDARVDGPANACGAFGNARLVAGDGTTYTSAGQGLGQSAEPATLVGNTIPVTLTAVVPSSELAAGNVYVWLNLRTYRQSQSGFEHCFAASEGPIGWTVSNFGVDIEQQFGDDCATQFLRNVTVDCDGNVVATTDTTLDGQPYTVTGQVGQCQTAAGGTPPPAPDVEVLALCDTADGTATAFLRHLVYPAGETTPTVVDTALDGVTPYTVAGEVDACAAQAAEPEECPARSVVETCRCDDTDGDGVADTEYVELLGVDCGGALTPLGAYLPDLSAPYTPVNPVPCDTGGAPAAVPVQARRAQLDPGQSWDAGAVPLLQSVTATAHGGTGTITTADGDSTLFPGESVTWSLVRDGDAVLVGPLMIAADTGTVTVAYTVAT